VSASPTVAQLLGSDLTRHFEIDDVTGIKAAIVLGITPPKLPFSQ